MKAERRRHDPEFKARVALEATRGAKTIREVAKECDIHPAQVSEWKKIMLSGAAELFERGASAAGPDESEREREMLHAQIGKLTVSVEFPKNSASSSAYRPPGRSGGAGAQAAGHARAMRAAWGCALEPVLPPQDAGEGDPALREAPDKIYMEDPTLGSRKLPEVLARD